MIRLRTVRNWLIELKLYLQLFYLRLKLKITGRI